MKCRTMLLIVVLLVTTSCTPKPPPTVEGDGLPRKVVQFIKKEPCKEKIESVCTETILEKELVYVISRLQPKISAGEVVLISELVTELSEEYDLNPYWMTAIMFTESRFNVNNVSSAGARGLMQIMPSTASKMYGVTKDKLFDPYINIDTGFKYYRYLKDIYKDDELATIAYNQGPGNVSRGTYKTWYYGRVKEVYQDIEGLREES